MQLISLSDGTSRRISPTRREYTVSQNLSADRVKLLTPLERSVRLLTGVGWRGSVGRWWLFVSLDPVGTLVNRLVELLDISFRERGRIATFSGRFLPLMVC
jgi:hypothetical protein